MKTEEYTEPETTQKGGAAGVAMMALVIAGWLLIGIRIGMVIDPLIANILTWLFFGPIAFVAVLGVLNSFLNKVK